MDNDNKNSDGGPVALTYQVEILPDADMDEVIQLTNEMRDLADKHAGTLIWETAFSGRLGYGYERYRNKTAFLEHLQMLEPLFPRIGTLWKTTMIVPTTEVDPELATMLASFGAVKPERVVTAAQTSQ